MVQPSASEERSTGSAVAAQLADNELAERVARRDAVAFSALYDRHSGYVVAVAARILGDREEAEEVAQDVFWQLWKGAVRYEPERGRFLTWLYSVAKSRSIDRLRGRTRRQRIGERLTEVPSEVESTARVTEAEESARVRRALDELPPEQREALGLCFFRGLSHSEAAERLGAPLGTVKSRIKLAMSKLRTSLADLEETL